MTFNEAMEKKGGIKVKTGFDCRECKHYYECLQMMQCNGDSKCFDRPGHPYYESKFDEEEVV